MILITGGARSGKSRFAEERAKAYDTVCYIATARVSDDMEMIDRIEKHRSRRPKNWKTVEEDSGLSEFIGDVDAVLLDCVTVMISNYLFDAGDIERAEDAERVEDRIKEELDHLVSHCDRHHQQLYIVTNEVGSGVVPMHFLSRSFRDIQGRINQYLAERAEEVYVAISGIPVKIK